MTNLPDTRGMSLPDAAAAWAGLGLRLCYETEDGTRALGQWRYADKNKTKLRDPHTPAQARAICERERITKLQVEPPKNLVVLDIDHRPVKGWNAEALGRELCQRFDIGRRPMVKTPSGGYHLWIALPEGFTTRNWTAEHGRFPIQGIDIRTYGGLATIPPSYRIASGDKCAGGYKWACYQSAPPMASHELIEALTPPPAPEIEQGETHPFSGSISTYCQRALESELQAVAYCGSGGRNAQLFKSSASLASIVAAGGLPEGPTRDALFNTAKQNGLLKDDGPHAVRSTIQSGFIQGSKSPRQLPTQEVTR